MDPQIPTHGFRERQQQGLGAPTAPVQPQGGTNPYVTPNVALEQAVALKNGDAQRAMEAARSNGFQKGLGNAQLLQAQALQAGAQAGKAHAEANIMNQLAGNQGGPEYLPEEIQAGQLLDDLLMEKVDPREVEAAANNGDPIALNALAMYQDRIARDQQTQLPQIDPGMGQVPGY